MGIIENPKIQILLKCLNNLEANKIKFIKMSCYYIYLKLLLPSIS